LPSGRRTARLTFSDGSVTEFHWYSDELRLDEESDFTGLTEREARTLLYATDAAYLRS
jgi:hypothetical protein